MNFLAAAIAILAVIPSAFGEAWVVSRTIDGIARNPESYSKLRSTMILGVALVETTAIYALLIAILCIFMGM